MNYSPLSEPYDLLKMSGKLGSPAGGGIVTPAAVREAVMTEDVIPNVLCARTPEKVEDVR